MGFVHQRMVMLATPFKPSELGSLGTAAYMLLRQVRFPHTYSDKDTILSADHDRCFMWDYKHAERCFKEHTGTGDLVFGNWVRVANEETVVKFLIDILKADASVAWTGFRILGTVNRSSGYPVWTLQLFAKHPESDTEVYSGHNGPNIKADENPGFSSDHTFFFI